MSKKALYLTGGGARGAYQAGVLKAIARITNSKVLPFSVVCGVSVGSINAAIISEYAHDFMMGVEKLEELWAEITCEHVFKASNFALSKSVFRNISTLVIKQSQSGHLLDTSPLRELISTHVDFDLIQANIDSNYLEAVEVATHCYETQQTVSFYQHTANSFEDWHYPRHISEKTTLRMEHILASSALPLFFPTVTIDGLHYGDGSMGLVSPLRGAIRFNVEKVMILGTRKEASFHTPEHLRNGDIGFAHILGGMLNGIFLDNLDRDIEMVNRMNDIAQLLSLWKKRRSPWRPIQTLHLRPSQDVGAIAQSQYSTMPTLLRYLLNLMGAKNHSGELLSFLLFEKEYSRQLLDMGYKDTIARAEMIAAFFS